MLDIPESPAGIKQCDSSETSQCFFAGERLCPSLPARLGDVQPDISTLDTSFGELEEGGDQTRSFGIKESNKGYCSKEFTPALAGESNDRDTILTASVGRWLASAAEVLAVTVQHLFKPPGGKEGLRPASRVVAVVVGTPECFNS